MPIMMPTPTTISLSSMNSPPLSIIAIILLTIVLAIFHMEASMLHLIFKKSQTPKFKLHTNHTPKGHSEATSMNIDLMSILTHSTMEQVVPFQVLSLKLAHPIVQEQVTITPYNPHQCFVMEIESLLSLVVVIPSQPSGVH